MKNNKRLRGVFAALICFAVMGLTSCVAILDDWEGTHIKKAYLPTCHDDEIFLTYTGDISDYDFDVDVYDKWGYRLNNYWIVKEQRMSHYDYSYEKEYIIQMNRSLRNDPCVDMIMVKCRNGSKSTVKYIYVNDNNRYYK